MYKYILYIFYIYIADAIYKYKDAPPLPLNSYVDESTAPSEKNEADKILDIGKKGDEKNYFEQNKYSCFALPLYNISSVLQ